MDRVPNAPRWCCGDVRCWAFFVRFLCVLLWWFVSRCVSVMLVVSPVMTCCVIGGVCLGHHGRVISGDTSHKGASEEKSTCRDRHLRWQSEPHTGATHRHGARTPCQGCTKGGEVFGIAQGVTGGGGRLCYTHVTLPTIVSVLYTGALLRARKSI